VTVAEDVAQVERDVGSMRAQLAGLDARVAAHDDADQQRHAEIVAGQARLEAQLHTLTRYMLGAIVVLAILGIGISAGRVAIDALGLGTVTIGQAGGVASAQAAP
jgi:hypothetical protein